MDIDIAGAITSVLDALHAAGVPATSDARNVNPPMAWVTTGDLTIETLAGGGSIVCNVDLIAPNVGETEARAMLNDLLSKALRTVDPDGAIETDRALPLNDGAVMLPVYRIPVSVEI